MSGVPAAFNGAGELPMPVAGRPPVGNGLGTAVSVLLHALEFRNSLAEPPGLEVRPVLPGDRGKPVDGAFHYPGSPPDTGVNRSNHGQVALIPLSPLASGTRYRCRVSLILEAGPFEYEWEFTTR